MYRLHIIIGATASGKEATACALAELWRDAEIITVDSMKIYRGLDIGTAKPSRALREKIPHHGLDLIAPDTDFSAADYAKFCADKIAEISARRRRVILVGGTALYYKALLAGLFPAPPADLSLREKLRGENPHELHSRLRQADIRAAEKIHPRDTRRIIRALEVIALTGKKFSDQQTQWENFYPGQTPEKKSPTKLYEPRIVWLNWERAALRQRIIDRVKKMLAANLVAEAREVFAQQNQLARAPLQAVGYKEFFPYFRGEISLDTAVAQLITRTGQLAKSQTTWFRKFPATEIFLTAETEFCPTATAEKAAQIFTATT